MAPLDPGQALHIKQGRVFFEWGQAMGGGLLHFFMGGYVPCNATYKSSQLGLGWFGVVRCLFFFFWWFCNWQISPWQHFLPRAAFCSLRTKYIKIRQYSYIVIVTYLYYILQNTAHCQFCLFYTPFI
jgi:hypothetical protein